MPKPNDPWALNPDGSVDPFVRVDYTLRPEDEVNLDDDQHLPIIPHEGLEPEVIQTPPPPEPEPVVVPPLPPEEDTPETLDLEDGTQLILKKEKGWWVGSVVGHAGGVQNYKGQTKNQLIQELMKAQANATKKIREQNLKLKHKPAAVPTQPTAQQLSAGPRQLTADEIFQYKTLWESDPVAAQDYLLQKTRGITTDQLLELAKKGAEANDNLSTEAVSRDFLLRNPSYYPTDTNFQQLVSYLAEYKLGKTVTDANAKSVFSELTATGNWTVENLEEAFEDLNSIGKLEQAPRQTQQTPPPPSPPVAVPVNEPAPAPRPDSRIVSQVTRPRAGLGLRQSDVTPVTPPAAQQPPSAEELENLSDEQISNLYAGIRRQRSLARRSN